MAQRELTLRLSALQAHGRCDGPAPSPDRAVRARSGRHRRFPTGHGWSAAVQGRRPSGLPYAGRPPAGAVDALQKGAVRPDAEDTGEQNAAVTGAAVVRSGDGVEQRFVVLTPERGRTTGTNAVAPAASPKRRSGMRRLRSIDHGRAAAGMKPACAAGRSTGDGRSARLEGGQEPAGGDTAAGQLLGTMPFEIDGHREHGERRHGQATDQGAQRAGTA